MYSLVNVIDRNAAANATTMKAAPIFACLRFRATEDPLRPEEQGDE